MLANTRANFSQRATGSNFQPRKKKKGKGKGKEDNNDNKGKGEEEKSSRVNVPMVTREKKLESERKAILRHTIHEETAL